MVPHDQQLEVASPGVTTDNLDSELGIKNLGGRTARPCSPVV